MNKTLKMAIIAVLVLLGLALLVPRRHPSEGQSGLPRYQFEPGLNFDYAEQTTDSGAATSKGAWEVWALPGKTAKSMDFVMRHISANVGDTGSILGRETHWIRGELTSDGRLTIPDGLDPDIDPRQILPPLPQSAEQSLKGWEVRDPVSDETVHYEWSADPAPAVDLRVIEARRDSQRDQLYDAQYVASLGFDVRRGLLQKSKTLISQRHANGSSEQLTTIELKKIERLPTASLQAFLRDADLYFETERSYRSLLRQARRDNSRNSELLETAEKLLQTAREKTSSVGFRAQFDRFLDAHLNAAASARSAAELRASLIGKPAADWDTFDLSGREHSLKELRGKVVVLDFWHAGCGWCIHSMPQIKQINHHFRNQPVVVLGMNTDPEVDPAKHVADIMQLDFPTLRAGGINQKYGVQGFPTLIIIDKNGNVADLHTGYSPTLKAEVIDSVQTLLKGPPS